MGKKVYNPISPHFWSHEEHCRFLEALEKCGNIAPSSTVWSMIADYVGTRNYKDVKLHANRYFLQLQMMNTQKRKEMHAMQAIDGRWTHEDDRLFEELLATYSDHTYYPWDIIASKFNNKTAKGVRERYYKLLFDIAHIESGHHITMHMKPWNSVDRDVQECNDDSDVPLYDCSTTLTADEEDLLLTVLEEASVPSSAPAPLLALVASSIVALSNHHNKIPPTRKETSFSYDDAARAIARALDSPASSVHTILENLLKSLSLKQEDDPFTQETLKRKLPSITEGSSREGSNSHEL